jgi:hypothetical protein
MNYLSMNFNKFIRKAANFGVTIYAMNEDETEYRFSTKWEIPCSMKRVDDVWQGVLYSRSPFVHDTHIKGTKKEVADKCLTFAVLGALNE